MTNCMLCINCAQFIHTRMHERDGPRGHVSVCPVGRFDQLVNHSDMQGRLSPSNGARMLPTIATNSAGPVLNQHTHREQGSAEATLSD